MHTAVRNSNGGRHSEHTLVYKRQAKPVYSPLSSDRET